MKELQLLLKILNKRYPLHGSVSYDKPLSINELILILEETIEQSNSPDELDDWDDNSTIKSDEDL